MGRARGILAKARATLANERIWMKSALVERERGETEEVSWHMCTCTLCSMPRGLLSWPWKNCVKTGPFACAEAVVEGIPFPSLHQLCCCVAPVMDMCATAEAADGERLQLYLLPLALPHAGAARGSLHSYQIFLPSRKYALSTYDYRCAAHVQEQRLLMESIFKFPYFHML